MSPDRPVHIGEKCDIKHTINNSCVNKLILTELFIYTNDSTKQQ